MSTRNLTDAEKAQLLAEAACAIRCANDVAAQATERADLRTRAECADHAAAAAAIAYETARAAVICRVVTADWPAESAAWDTYRAERAAAVAYKSAQALAAAYAFALAVSWTDRAMRYDAWLAAEAAVAAAGRALRWTEDCMVVKE